MTPQQNQATPLPAATLAILEDLRRAGVTDIVGETPHDWFAAPSRPPLAKPTFSTQSASNPSAAPRAVSALKPVTKPCKQAPLPEAKIWLTGTPTQALIIAGASTAQAGQSPLTPDESTLLTNMLKAINITEFGILAIAITDEHETPYSAEAYTSFTQPMQKELKTLKTPAHFALGQVATQIALQTERSLSDLRDTPLQTALPSGATYHPRTLLKQPALKRLAWQDLLMFKERLSHT